MGLLPISLSGGRHSVADHHLRDGWFQVRLLPSLAPNLSRTGRQPFLGHQKGSDASRGQISRTLDFHGRVCGQSTPGPHDRVEGPNGHRDREDVSKRRGREGLSSSIGVLSRETAVGCRGHGAGPWQLHRARVEFRGRLPVSERRTHQPSLHPSGNAVARSRSDGDVCHGQGVTPCSQSLAEPLWEADARRRKQRRDPKEEAPSR
mmetsp:Transcript_47099/g.121722  ORF Transcript_47099/g.121722 Transcript_47099/m.121722 type:complete len:205 (-) Transcript_47099:673-1287(-)